MPPLISVAVQSIKTSIRFLSQQTQPVQEKCQGPFSGKTTVTTEKMHSQEKTERKTQALMHNNVNDVIVITLRFVSPSRLVVVM